MSYAVKPINTPCLCTKVTSRINIFITRKLNVTQDYQNQKLIIKLLCTVKEETNVLTIKKFSMSANAEKSLLFDIPKFLWTKKFDKLKDDIVFFTQ